MTSRARARPAEIWLALTLAVTATSVSACKQDGFKCGRELRGEDGIAQRCTGELEVCVCATSSCAVRELADESKSVQEGCASGYRYLDKPFANDSWAKECVPKAHLALPVLAPDAAPFCPGRAPPPKDAGHDDERDAGRDAGRDPRSDAGKDAGRDAGRDDDSDGGNGQ